MGCEVNAEITIHYDVNRLSPNKRDFWATKAKKIKAARTLAAQAWRDAGALVFSVPVSCEITIYRGRTIDADNALACCKSLIDGIFGGNATPDDSSKWVAFAPVRVISRKQYKDHPHVIFRISEQGEK